MHARMLQQHHRLHAPTSMEIHKQEPQNLIQHSQASVILTEPNLSSCRILSLEALRKIQVANYLPTVRQTSDIHLDTNLIVT